MNAEKLRLEAEMRDNASPVVRKLKKELADLNEATREGRSISKLNKELEKLRKETSEIRATPGMHEATKWLGKATEGAEGFVKSGGGAAGVIGAMGIGGLTAAASLSSLTALMKEMGDRALGMKELGREVGMTVDQINAFAHAGAHFGVGADSMRGALDHLSGQMPEFRRNYGAMFQELSRWPDLIKKLQGEGTEDQVKDIFKFLDQPKLRNEPQLQKQILGSIFGSGDEMEKLFAQGAQGFLGELEKQKKQLGPISPEMLKQAQDFRDATIKFNDALERFETTVGPAFLGMMTGIVDKAAQILNPDRSAIEKKQREGGARDEKENEIDLNDPRIKNALRKKSAYSGGGGLLNLASFGGSIERRSDTGDAIADGTKAGVLAAFRELMAVQGVESGSGGGILNASFGGGNGGGLGAGTAGRGFQGGASLDGANLRGGDASGEEADVIRGLARKYGIDPRVAVAVAKSEGLGVKWGSGMDRGTSFGAFQLHVGGGLGDIFQRQTGLDPRDHKNWREMDDFALKYASKNGWSPWHGAARIGVHGMAGIGGSMADGLGSGSDIGMHLHTLNQECVSLAQAAVHAGGTVHQWRRGVDALAGTLKPGTPIATFLDRQGRQTDRYAGGGNGTPGAHLDHAGIFQSYIRDKDGKIVGMNMAEQYRGSHGVHSKAYGFGQGWGEGNASNYSAIMGANGRPLGGDLNPMARRADGLREPAQANAQRPTPGAKHHLDVHIRSGDGLVTSAAFRPGSDGGVIKRLTRWPTNRDFTSI